MKKTLLVSFIAFFFVSITKAQNSFNFNCAKDTTIDCTQNCITLTARVPDVHSSTTDYGVNLTSGPGGCFRPPISPSIPGTSTNLDRDDKYTPVIPMPFDFPFYGIIYAQLVVNTNGIISFDLSNANLGAQWTITADGTLPSPDYDRAIIMGAYHDIDIQFPNTSPTKQIKYDVLGTAPHRRWVLSFYKVPCFQNTCWPKINNTYQITLYEGLGLVEVHVWGREICNTWNNGNAMIGMQDYDQNKGIMAPGRQAWTTPRWGSPTMNESWRFTPKDGPSLLKQVNLTDLSGNVVSAGVISPGDNNEVEVTFPNVCLNTTTQYIVESQYYHFEYPFQFPARDSIVKGKDTITVYKAASVPPIDLTTTQALCGANPNGSITVTAPLGASYEYSIGGGYQSSPNFSVPPGTYTVSVREVSGTCTRDTTVTISAPTTLSGSATSTNTSCPEASNGSITATGSQGTGTYTYALDNIAAPVFGSSNIFNNVTAGDHTVFIKDAAGCIFSFTHTVNSDPVFTTTANSVNATCLGALNGSITVTLPASGQAPFTYSIPGGPFAPYQASATFSGLAGDSTYTVNVKDNAGCVYALTQAVGYDPGVTASVITQNANCSGVNNGYIVLNPTGGTAPYFYQVDTGSAPSFVALDTIRHLGSGLYDVTIRDNIGCLYNIQDISVSSGSGVNATFVIKKSACATASTGSIAINITAFTGTAPFSFSVNSGAFQAFAGSNASTDTVKNLAPGNYVIEVKDAVGCIFTSQPITVGADPDIQASFVIKPTACAAATTGQVAVTPLSGFGPFSYSLDNAGFVSLNDTIRGLDSGIHNIIIRDAIGCTTTINPDITLGTGVSATFTPVNSACTAASTGKIAITVSSGIAPFTYSTNAGVNNYPLDTIRNLSEGTYNVLIRDAVGCEFTAPVTVGSNNPGVGATFTTVNSACSGVSTGKIAITPTLGVAPFSYSTDAGANYYPVDTIRNLAGNTYTIRVRDALGCTFDSPVTVSNDPGVNATFTTVKSACSAASTGRIIATVTSGVSPFDYSINAGTNFYPLDTIRNLSEGTYNVLIRDAAGCQFTAPVTVTSNNPGVGATFTTINSACSGVSTGKIAITPTLGVAPFSYSTDAGANYYPVDTIRNLAGNTYTIRVRDALGCTFDSPVTVNNDPGVNATFTTVKSACTVASTGRIIATVTSGVSPFDYSINAGTNFYPLDTIRNLSEGVYNVLIRDAVGCQFTAPVTVTSNNPGVGATFTTINSACSGVSTGKIAITPTLGVAPFTYSTDAGANYYPLDTIRNLAGNTYNIRVRDALGCTFDAPPVTVGNDPGVNATFTTVKSACTVASTGRIIATVTSGISPFNYSVNAGANFFPLDTIRNLSEGVYNVLIRDAVGCQFTAPVTVTSNNPGVGATFTTVNSACSGVSTGKIIITPTVGVAPFTYSTDAGTNYYPVDTIRNLAGNTYNIRVRDALGCTFDAPPVTVNNDLGVTASFSSVKAACAGAATGAIIVKPLTGTPGFSYSLDAGGSYQADSVFRNLAANAYNIRIRDAVGCIYNSPVVDVTNNPGVLTNASTIQNASCESIPNGSIAVNVTAGIAPFTYVITAPVAGTPQTANQFTSLSSGSYDITIRDSAGCTRSITSIVGSDPKVKIDSLNTVEPTCKGLQNGTITVNVSLGVSPYQYAMDAGGFGTSKNFASISAGQHIIRIKDANNCAIDSTFIVTEPALLTASIASTSKATCSGNPDGSIDALAAGGTPPYQYTLDLAANTGYQTSPSFNVLKGSYTVTVEDDNGCKATANATVDSVFTMYLDLGAETTVCSGSALTLSPSTNPETDIFSYSPKGSLDKDNVKNPVATPTDTTTYTVTARWGICTLTDNIKVNVLRKPRPYAGEDVIICYDTTTTLRATASNLSGTVNFSWSPANLLDTKADTTVVVARPQEENTYYVVTVRDNYNCNFAVSDSVLVKMLPPVYAFAGNDTNAVLNKAHQLYATGAGVGGSYVWDYPPSGVTISDRTVANPTAIFVPVPEPGTYVNPDTNYYRLSVTATNAAGCKATDTIKINVFIGPTTYVPSAFSPNGDGINDIFKPVNVGVNIQYFQVFNRYGEIVFQTSRFRDGWDGMFKGKAQPSGAYVWVFKGRDARGREIVEKGTVMLVR